MKNTINHYNRLIAASTAVQILDNSKIKINIPLLKVMIKNRPTNEKRKYYHNGKDTGYIQTKYYSRDKITSRIFTKAGNLNLITLSDPDIKQCINSRYEDGQIVEIDYKAFEYGIICKILDINLVKDIHSHIAEVMGCTREEAKKINNAFFYGASENTILNIQPSFDYLEYTCHMGLFIQRKNEYLKQLEIDYDKNGFVINPFGRKIYPKSKYNIFNNVIQSTGSDILIDVIINIKKSNTNFNLLFHRFDSLFFDLQTSDLNLNLSELVNIIIIPQYDLSINTHIGRNLNELKKLKE